MTQTVFMKDLGSMTSTVSYSERPWLLVSKGQDLNSWPLVQQTGTSQAVF